MQHIPSPEQGTILIVERNPILAEGMRSQLSAEKRFSKLVVMVLAPDDLSAAAHQRADVVILDPFQTDLSASAIVEIFTSIAPATALIGYCPDLSIEHARSFMMAGFRGLVPKTVSVSQLSRVITSVAYGGVYMHETYNASELRALQPKPVADAGAPGLTLRELQVLRAVALGSSIKEIAETLQVSSKTVDTYKARATEKLSLNRRADIIQFAIQSGWMQLQQK